MPAQLNRRSLLKTTAAASAGFWLGTASPRRAEAANDKLNLAFVGVGGRGRDNLNALAREGQNIVALCDVDDQRAGDAYERFPQAKRYVDFRRMLDEMDAQIDGVVISTPDHTHFHPAWETLQRGKHLYCEKPLAHNVWEVRQLTQLAAEKGVATQLGVQRHTLPHVHRAVELIQAGAIGQVHTCYSWVGGTRGMPERPTTHPSVPDHLDWDLWLGPAAVRRYSPEYVPYKWRFWWDFGTGETGNWGCHILDIPFWALGLTYPEQVQASGPEVDPDRTPRQMNTQFRFPAAGDRGPITLHWSHAEHGPEILRQKNLPHGGNNTLFVGTEGMLLCGFGQHKLYPEEKFAGFQAPESFIPNSPGFYREWVTACQGGSPATCQFDYSGPLTETVLLGNVAYRAGAFRWNAQALRAEDNDRANQLLREEYRKGWQI